MCVDGDSHAWRRGVGLSSGPDGSASRFAAYLEAITAALGHADRVAPLRWYCAGLLLAGARKSVAPMAARVQPGRVAAAHQSLHHFVAKADWSDAAMLAAVRARVLPSIARCGPIRALIIDGDRRSATGHTFLPKRQALGRRGAAVLRPTRQAGAVEEGGSG
jgi:SRSO17 transposase